jgi:chromosome segregation ATPase
MSSTSIRTIVVPVAGLACALSASALAWDPPWLDESRWIVACVFPLSLVAFLFAYTARRLPPRPATPESRAEERMGAVRVALLTEKLQELQTAHDALATELARLRASPPVASAASVEDRPDPIPGLRAELEKSRAELDRTRASQTWAENLARETAGLRAALAAAEVDAVALNERVASFHESSVLAKVEAERLRTDLDAARAQDQSARTQALAREDQALRARIAAFEAEAVATDERTASAAATAEALRIETEELRTALVEARAGEARAENLAAEHADLRVALSVAEAASVALTERVACAEARSTQLTSETERLRADLDAARARDQSARAESLATENDALRARATGLEAEIVAARGRIEETEARVAGLQAAELDLRRRLASELANARARGGRLNLYRAAAPDPGAEVARLRRRVEETEEAVRAALRELGVRDAAGWPTTVEGVTQAVGPLTLCAMGEQAPGWNPNPDEDTLAAAVLALSVRSAERQRQLERIGASITQNGRKH